MIDTQRINQYSQQRPVDFVILRDEIDFVRIFPAHNVFFFFFLQQDCPNGRLTPAKFVDMYKMFFPSGNAEEFCDHVFRTFDMDKNGYIDFKVSEMPFLFPPLEIRNLSGWRWLDVKDESERRMKKSISCHGKNIILE